MLYEEVLPFPRDASNPHGVGFGTTTTPIEKECSFNLDWNTNRTVKLVNATKLNPVSGKPVGYKISGEYLAYPFLYGSSSLWTPLTLSVPPTQLGLADDASMHNIRGEFINHHIHVTKHSDEEMYAAGDYPWQSVGGQGGCRTWSERGRQLEQGDSVCWITIGFTHVTRPEGMFIISDAVIDLAWLLWINSSETLTCL